MKYFILAGEASGDLHGSQLIHSIRRYDSEAQVIFFGGDKMAEASGSQPMVHYRDMAYMGFVEVVKHLGAILGFLAKAKNIIDEILPDAVILIDYPSFNLKVAKYAHSKGIKTFYFISPKVWAWKEWRVKEIKKYVTALYSILPFETEFFARYGYKVQYVGNPTVNEIAEAKKSFSETTEFRRRNGLSEKPIIAIVPGSRKKEIRDNLPTMVKSAASFTLCQMVIAGAPGIDEEYYKSVMRQSGITDKIPVLFSQSFELVAASRVALVTSGTATLETAVLGIPQVVCYRMSGNKFLYLLYKLFIKVKFVSLPNLIVGREVIPELLLHHCNESKISGILSQLLMDSPERMKMLQGYETMKKRLGENDCTDTTAQLMMKLLAGKTSK